MPDSAQPVLSPAETIALQQEREGVRVEVKTFLTTELQKGQVAVEKARAVAIAAKEEIEATHTANECTEVIPRLAVKFPETLDGLVVQREESVSRSAELEIAHIVVTWIKEGKADWAASLAKEAAESLDDVAILKKIKQEVGV